MLGLLRLPTRADLRYIKKVKRNVERGLFLEGIGGFCELLYKDSVVRQQPCPVNIPLLTFT